MSDYDPIVRDDEIARLYLNARDLREALADAGHVHQVRVAEQSRGQLLYVGVVVSPMVVEGP